MNFLSNTRRIVATPAPTIAMNMVLTSAITPTSNTASLLMVSTPHVDVDGDEIRACFRVEDTMDTKLEHDYEVRAQCINCKHSFKFQSIQRLEAHVAGQKINTSSALACPDALVNNL